MKSYHLHRGNLTQDWHILSFIYEHSDLRTARNDLQHHWLEVNPATDWGKQLTIRTKYFICTHFEQFAYFAAKPLQKLGNIFSWCARQCSMKTALGWSKEFVHEEYLAGVRENPPPPHLPPPSIKFLSKKINPEYHLEMGATAATTLKISSFYNNKTIWKGLQITSQDVLQLITIARANVKSQFITGELLGSLANYVNSKLGRKKLDTYKMIIQLWVRFSKTLSCRCCVNKGRCVLVF